MILCDLDGEETALHVASGEGWISVVKALLHNGAHPNIIDYLTGSNISKSSCKVG